MGVVTTSSLRCSEWKIRKESTATYRMLGSWRLVVGNSNLLSPQLWIRED